MTRRLSRENRQCNYPLISSLSDISYFISHSEINAALPIWEKIAVTEKPFNGCTLQVKEMVTKCLRREVINFLRQPSARFSKLKAMQNFIQIIALIHLTNEWIY